MKKPFLSWLRFIKKTRFFSEKISRSFIYPSLNNSEPKFQKHLFQNYRVPLLLNPSGHDIGRREKINFNFYFFTLLSSTSKAFMMASKTFIKPSESPKV